MIKKRIKEIAEHNRRKENVEEFKLLGTYIARIEHFCVGVEQEIYDWKRRRSALEYMTPIEYRIKYDDSKVA